MKKVAFGLPVVLGLGSAFAQQGSGSGMTTYADADAAITAIGTVASSAFNTFSTTIRPVAARRSCSCRWSHPRQVDY